MRKKVGGEGNRELVNAIVFMIYLNGEVSKKKLRRKRAARTNETERPGRDKKGDKWGEKMKRDSRIAR